MSPDRRAAQTITRRRPSNTLPHGFLKPPKARPSRVEDLSEQELLHERESNAQIINSSNNSGATASHRMLDIIIARQKKIEKRIGEIKNTREVANITRGVENTSISADENMDVDRPPGPLQPIQAKLRALAKYSDNFKGIAILRDDEADRIVKDRCKHDKERQEERERRRNELPTKTEGLSKEKILAFMNPNGTFSDMEDDSDSDGGDPATWFVDDQEGGIKGQPIVQPDIDEPTVIRIDESKAYVGYSTFYEPRDDQ